MLIVVFKKFFHTQLIFVMSIDKGTCEINWPEHVYYKIILITYIKIIGI